MVADPVLGPLAQPISRENFVPALAEMCQTFDWSQFHIVETVIDTDGAEARAAVRLSGLMIHIPSDIRFELETLDLLTFRDGRVVRFREYFDTLKAAKMLGLDG